MMKKLAISGFVVLNLFTVLFMNRSGPFKAALDERVDRLPGRYPAYVVRYAGWLVHRYAHLVGLDNQWKMFGRQSRMNWWFVIQAVHEDGSTEVLPLPLQNERKFWQHTLFDFKENKFHLNLYGSSEARKNYAHYLFRQYPATESGTLFSSIRFELKWQAILPRPEASEKGIHVETAVHSQTMDEFRRSGN